MLNFDKIILNFVTYGLHDTEINNVELFQDGLNLIFNKGIYCLDEKGKEIHKTEKCKIEIKILNFDIGNISESLEIIKIYRNKKYELNFNEFLKLLDKGVFEIEYNFISAFNNAILLKGFIEKNRIELLVSNIFELNVDFI